MPSRFMAGKSIYKFDPKLTENSDAQIELQIFSALLKYFEEDKKFERHYSRTKDETYKLGKGKKDVRITF